VKRGSRRYAVEVGSTVPQGDWPQRILDIAVAGPLLALALPFLAAAALGVRLTSAGPVLYRAKRAGVGGVPFRMYKIRTMHVGSDRQSAITAPDDPRIFAFGRFLRATRIDELPQLVNILKGDMSLVGPRPEDPRIVNDHFDARMRETLRVRPGITSPGTLLYLRRFREAVHERDATASYASGILREKIEADLMYAERRNVFSDIGVLLQTVVAVVAKAVRTPGKE
jgi:lipopolysaccharide/colanic/teichoic acid biosynthesis glycosyltransferase